MKLHFLKLDNRYGSRRFGIHGFTYGISYDDGEEIKISPQVALTIYTAMAYRYPNVDTFADVLWPDQDDTPDTFWNSISVQITVANRSLRPGGLEIRPLGRRWTLARIDESRAIGQPLFKRPIKTVAIL